MPCTGPGTGHEECVLVEVHAPACDPLRAQERLGLYAENETPDLSSAVETLRTGEVPTRSNSGSSATTFKPSGR